MAGVNRALGPAERFNWLADHAQCTNFAVTAEVDGALVAARVRSALDAAQARHPMLRARVSVQRGKVVFDAPDCPPIPLEVIAADADADPKAWLRTLEHVQDAPFEVGSCPLARCYLFASPDTAVLMLAFNHAIADARSAANVLVELIEHATAATPPELPTRPPPAALESLYPWSLRGLAARLRMVMSFFGLILRVIRDGYPKRVWPLPSARGVGSRQTKVVTFELDVSALVARCRQEGTTVHGALMAAHLLSAGELLGVRSGSITHAVDLRPHLTERPTAEDLGYYITLIPTFHRVAGDFWALARSGRQQLVTLRDRGDGHLWWWTIPPALLLPPNEVGASRIAKLVLLGPPGTMITNIGRVLDSETVGTVRVRSLRFAIGPPDNYVHVVAASAVGSKLFVTISYNPSVLEPRQAADLASRMRDLLRAAAEAG